MTRVAAVIPARHEERTIGAVVDVVKQSTEVDEVIVVDNDPDDGDRTAELAEAHGATVVRCDQRGKGQAMAAGVAATDASVVLFLDADLTGLTVEHVDHLVTAVDGEVGMAMGLFDRGAAQNWWFLHVLPILTGQRALWRELWEELDPDDYRGYKVEAALNSLCASLDISSRAFVCEGLFHVPKEEKYDTATSGFVHKQGMLLSATWSYVSFKARWLARRRWRRRSPATPHPAAPPSTTRDPDPGR